MVNAIRTRPFTRFSKGSYTWRPRPCGPADQSHGHRYRLRHNQLSRGLQRFRRSQPGKKVTYSWTDYGCCGPINSTNREGTVFKNHRDALNRTAARQNVSLNITATNIYDAGKNLAQRRRIGSDGSTITNISYTYDTAGRVTPLATRLAT